MTPLPLGNGAGESARTAPIQTPMLTRMAYISVLHAAVPRGAATPDNQFPEAYPASEMLGFWDRAARWRSQSLFLVGGLHYSADMNWKGDNWARARLSPQTVLLGEAAKRRGFQVRGLAFCRGVISSSSDFCHSLITVLSQPYHSLVTVLSQSLCDILHLQYCGSNGTLPKSRKWCILWGGLRGSRDTRIDLVIPALVCKSLTCENQEEDENQRREYRRWICPEGNFLSWEE